MRRQIAPDEISPVNAGLLLCVPDNMLGMLRQALWAYQFSYAYKRHEGDIEGAKRVFVDLIGQIDMSCCDVIADCIEDSENVRNALDQWFSNSETTMQTIQNITNNTFNNAVGQPDIVDCRDELFGGIFSLVGYIHETNIDFFERVEVATNFVENVANLGNKIPIIGGLTIGLIAEAINKLLEDIEENYVSQWTVDSQIDISCEIFCLVECGELSLDSVLAYYEAKIAGQFTFSLEGLGNLLQSAVTGNYSNVVDWVSWMHYFQLQWVRLASGDFVDWIALDPNLPRNYERAIILGYFNPSQAWMLCDCAPLLYFRLGGAGNAGLEPINLGYGVATYNAGLDLYEGLQNEPNNTYNSVGLEITEPLVSLSVEIEANQTRAGGFVQFAKNQSVIETYSIPLGITNASFGATVNAGAGDVITVALIVGSLTNGDASYSRVIRIEGAY